MIMIYYYIITAIALAIQLLILLEGYRNLVYTVRCYRPKPSEYQPRVALFSPCKGLDTTFDRNINSLFEQDYADYEIFFVVEDAQDAAYARLGEIIEQRKQAGCAVPSRVLVAGPATSSAQKVHNLTAAVDVAGSDFEVLAVVDSDACLKSHFLRSLVRPLRREKVGASTGYRWFVPTDSALASHTLSAINASIASLMGPHNWNNVWGGAMAIRRELFEQTDVRRGWLHACSDDYAVTNAVKRVGLLVVFVPACYVASYERTSWSELFDFARRQFLITRIAKKRLWVLAILSVGHYVAAFWGGLIVTVCVAAAGRANWPYAAILPGGLMLSGMVKAIVRQVMIRKILPEDTGRLLGSAVLDVLAQPVLAVFTLVCLIASGMSRVMVWRRIKYVLHDEDHTEVIRPEADR